MMRNQVKVEFILVEMTRPTDLNDYPETRSPLSRAPIVSSAHLEYINAQWTSLLVSPTSVKTLSDGWYRLYQPVRRSICRTEAKCRKEKVHRGSAGVPVLGHTKPNSTFEGVQTETKEESELGAPGSGDTRSCTARPWHDSGGHFLLFLLVLVLVILVILLFLLLPLRILILLHRSLVNMTHSLLPPSESAMERVCRASVWGGQCSASTHVSSKVFQLTFISSASTAVHLPYRRKVTLP
ncbi:unnamed protein product [Protopolystoma xenopodis]|uniref:Uncharacterized protein n=1 Tax=Protopolystoma xenopodis TaxID=117903 RepID=A0A448WF54_9PLAT|nr:unnamed protein product [Protopolystoma xenopodis]